MNKNHFLEEVLREIIDNYPEISTRKHEALGTSCWWSVKGPVSKHGLWVTLLLVEGHSSYTDSSQKVSLVSLRTDQPAASWVEIVERIRSGEIKSEEIFFVDE